MKHTYMTTFKKILATALFSFAAVLAFSTITTNNIAYAGSSFDYDGAGGWDYFDYGGGSSWDYGGAGGWDYFDYSSPSYTYGGSDWGGGYSYVPSAQYVYTPVATGFGGGWSGGGAGLQYVYTSSSSNNTNTNSNTNTITNTFNPVNNNDARINLIVLGGGGSGNNNTYQSLSGSCTINPSVAYVNQDVSFSATASGGNGGYTYSWTGDNGIYSSSQSFTGRFSFGGVKNATVTIRSSDGQTITRSCSVNVQDTNVVGGAYCVANPSVAGVNQNVTWTVFTPNNTLGYTYYWSGTDGLSGFGQSINRVYNTPGYKTATVTVTGNGQTFTTNCATTIQGGIVGGTSNVTVLRDQTPVGTPVSGVFLNQVPDTGISFGLKTTLFTIGLLLWSAFGAYVLSRKTKVQSVEGGNLSKAELFKRANMLKKGIIA
ncbi:MAG: hypothetical protein FGM57_02895 [Candidatus Taylorbacteria bacterium]|nr:hypothetical protein [Candidatus Taylorbacteria bacterium]